MNPVQKFSDDYLATCRQMTTEQIVRFVEDFRRLHGSQRSRSRLISIKVPEDLLESFRTKARLRNTPYQSQIKALMTEWVLAEKN